MTSLALGVAIGLLITWVFWPVQYSNADAADLRPSIKDEYIRMIGGAYQVDGDLAAARQRLSRLGLRDPIQSINNLAVRDQKRAPSDPSAAALTSLAESLAVRPAIIASQQTPQAVIVVTTPTQAVPTFRLVEHQQLGCQDTSDNAVLQFVVRDVAGHDLPNVGIQIRWSGGDDTIYTGLKPERGIGYADYAATPGTYSVTILNAQSETISDLVIGNPPANCNTDRGATPRGWKLIFQQQQ